MDLAPLLQDPVLNRDLAAVANLIREPDHAVSDIVDAADHQYVDLVMEGGGLLGVALVGYTWALERMGLRFLGMGGTSAGSINALLLAGLDDLDQAKSPRLLAALTSKNFYDFVDGGQDVRDLLDLALDGRPVTAWKATRLIARALGVKDRVARRYGLNPGDAFVFWLSGLLRAAGIATLADLDARLARRPPGLARRGAAPFAPDDRQAPDARLVVVAADVWSETRVEFPAMAELYWPDPAAVNPALFVRASMAVPGFFEPLRLDNLPADEAAWGRWRRHAGLYPEQTSDGNPPVRALLVDGGLMSNFPINAFHEPGVPSMPTFGVKLELDNRVDCRAAFTGDTGLAGLSGFGGMLGRCMQRQLDFEFIRRNPDYRHLVKNIPCLREHPDGRKEPIDWLNFQLPDADKRALFRQGAEAAIEFVRDFASPVDAAGRPAADPAAVAFRSRWSFYKALRAQLATLPGA